MMMVQWFFWNHARRTRFSTFYFAAEIDIGMAGERSFYNAIKCTCMEQGRTKIIESQNYFLDENTCRQISSLTDSRNLLYLRVLSMRKSAVFFALLFAGPPCAAAPSRKWSRVWEAICLYSLILSGKINHESRFSLLYQYSSLCGLCFLLPLLRGAFLAEGRHAQ